MLRHKDWYTCLTSTTTSSLLAVRDSKKYPVLAYALAGDITEEHYIWLLHTLGSAGIQSQSDANFIAIAATFGSVQRLKLLLNGYYDPTEHELQDGLFFSVYHGQEDMFDFLLSTLNKKITKNNRPALTPNELRDESNNTLLHVAVMGGHPGMINIMGCYPKLLTVRNNQEHLVIDEAVLSNNTQLVIQIAYVHSLHQTSVNYGDLVLVLIRSVNFLYKKRTC